MTTSSPYPPICDYAMISDCHSVGLVSSAGSIDWLCMPRIDGPSIFGRLLDWERGGHLSIAPTAEHESTRRYLPGTLVLETTLRTDGGAVRIRDAVAMRRGGRTDPSRTVVRIVDGLEGEVELAWEVAPRLEYGSVRPWVRGHGPGVHTAVGGSTGLVIVDDVGLSHETDAHLEATASVRAGERRRVAVTWRPAHELDRGPDMVVTLGAIDHMLHETIEWWTSWSDRARTDDLPDADGVVVSAMVLKGLTNPLTGAIAAAGTTSLPEAMGGARNWDYRYSWIRDSAFSVRELADLGYPEVASGFRRFVERSAAGDPLELQVVYGVGGEVRLDEVELDLEGYRGSAPVRIGNQAFSQLQLDTAGYVVVLSRRWSERNGHPDEDYWAFLCRLVDSVCDRWQEPDRGIWEVRGDPQHFVHSKAMCWAALDAAIDIASRTRRESDQTDGWREIRDRIRETIEDRGYDEDRGVFVRAFGETSLDAALLLLPRIGFVDYDDPRMIRTVDAIADELADDHGLIRRYRVDDGLEDEEGTFLATSFWLAECYARQGRMDEARHVFDRTVATRNDLGLFAEEYDPRDGTMLGNFPQGLSHLTHIGAAMAIAGR